MAASAAMAAVLWALCGWLAPQLVAGAPLLDKGTALLILVAVGAAVYFSLAFGLGGVDLGMIRRNVKRGRMARAAPEA